MREAVETTAEVLARNAVVYRDRPALIAGTATFTYAELDAEVDRLSRGLLSYGVQKGDRVALLMDNRPEWLFIDFALGRIGAILVPINMHFRRVELEYVLSHAQPRILVFVDRFRTTDFVGMLGELFPGMLLPSGEKDAVCSNHPYLKHVFCLSDRDVPGVRSYRSLLSEDTDGPVPIGEVTGSDVASILYTSGTTASPKGVMLTHANICLNAKRIAERIHIVEDDRSWVPIPLFFSFGCITALMSTFEKGACLVLQREFEPGQALRLIERERCTLMFATPNMYLGMLDCPSFSRSAVSSLRSGTIMGTSEQLRRVVVEMGVTGVNTGYGMTETSALSALTDSHDVLDVRLTTAGRPFTGVSVVIRNPETGQPCPPGIEGEIRVKGYNVTCGYFKDPERTAEAFDEEGYLGTGDLGMISADGYLHFRGRMKDMYKSGGIIVSALEVETFLQSHPSVLEASVISVPDPQKDEIGIAFVKLRSGAQCDEQELLAFCKGRIASYKIPAAVRFVEQFPMTGSGKVQKFRLRELALGVPTPD